MITSTASPSSRGLAPCPGPARDIVGDELGIEIAHGDVMAIRGSGCRQLAADIAEADETDLHGSYAPGMSTILPTCCSAEGALRLDHLRKQNVAGTTGRISPRSISRRDWGRSRSRIVQP